MGTRLCRGGARGERGGGAEDEGEGLVAVGYTDLSLILLRPRRKQPSWRGCPFVCVRPSARCGRGWRYHKLRRELFNRQHQGYKPKVIAAVSEYFDTFHWACVLHCHDNIQQPNKGIVSSIIP